MIKQNFNKSWELKHDISTIMESVVPSEADVEMVNLPHDELISRPRYAECNTGAYMAFFEGEDIQYIKKLHIPLSERDKVHYICFDGVYMNAVVIINNRFVTRHANGYTPFTIRIDDYLNYDAENEMKVQIRGTAQPNARWYPGLGIYRDVFYMTGDFLHILNDSVHVTTIDCDEELASLKIDVGIFNAGTYGRAARMEFIIKDGSGDVVKTGKAKFYAMANTKVNVSQRFNMVKPSLWDAENPNLYTVEVKIVEDGKEIDTAETYFGIRKIQFDSVHGMRVNGKSIKLKGGAVHHDNAILGAVSVIDAEIRKMKLLKTGGYNAIRTAHNPPSAALLEACDRVGVYVMHEYTDVWTDSKATYDFGQFFATDWERDVENIIQRDYNHPSIVIWSIGNEIPETGDTVSVQWGRKLVEKYHSLDATRPVTNALNLFTGVQNKVGEIMAEMGIIAEEGGLNDVMNAATSTEADEEFGMPEFMNLFASNAKAQELMEEAVDMLDIVGYNYTADIYEKQHELHPDQLYLGTETHPSVLDHNWEIVMRNPYAIGDFCWTGWDYLGEVGAGRLANAAENDGKFMGEYPWICAYTADFNLIGDRRPISYWRDTIWTGREHKPYISVHDPSRYGKKFVANYYAWTDSIPTWSWTGYEGKMTGIEIYCDADEIELIVNGHSLGRQLVGTGKHKYYCKFEAEYQPGELEAIAYIDNKEVGRQKLKTVGRSEMSAAADKAQLRAGSNDLCYIMVQLKDQNGTLDMLSDKKVTAKVNGVVLAGMGSADPTTEEYYQWDAHKFFEGKCLAIVKAGNEPCKGSVTFSCEGCKDVSVEVEVVPVE